MLLLLVDVPLCHVLIQAVCRLYTAYSIVFGNSEMKEYVTRNTYRCTSSSCVALRMRADFLRSLVEALPSTDPPRR
jgi:hypothetical protein